MPKVYLIHPKDDPPFLVCQSWDDVRDTIESGDIDEEWVVRVTEMSTEEIENLPEFDGW